MNKSVMVLVGVMAATCAVAETTPVVWTNTVYKAGDTEAVNQWGLPENWTDANGDPIAVAPTNGADRFAVTLTPDLPADTGRKLLSTGKWKGGSTDIYLANGAVDPAIDSIVGPARYTVRHTVASYSTCQTPRVFEVANPNGFLGWWEVGDANGWFRLTATDGFVPTLRGLNSQCRPYVEVPSAGTVARVDIVTGNGLVAKQGAGTLEVGLSVNPSTGAYVEAGDLMLDGADTDNAALKALLAKAALHLDASVASTLTHTNIVERPGFDFISRWDDVRGNGNFARPHKQIWNATDPDYLHETWPGFICADRSPTGLPLVSFGSTKSQAGKLGPTNCVMELSQSLTGIREAFFTEYAPDGIDGALLGGLPLSSQVDYRTGGDRILCGWSAQPEGMRTGELFKNGVSYGWNDTAMTVSKMTTLTTISIASDVGGRISLLGSDRDYVSGTGGMSAGEIILFTNVLTRAERVLVNRYLDAKWRTGENLGATAGSVIVSDGASVGVKNGEAAVADVALEGGTLVKTGAGTLVVDTLHTTADGAALDVRGGDVRFASVLRTPTTDKPADGAYIWLDASDGADFVTEADDETAVVSWKDHRGLDIAARAVDGYKAASESEDKVDRPHIVDNATRGLKAVSLGLFDDVNQTYFVFPTWGLDGAGPSYDKAYAGFLVMRHNDLKANTRNYFGSSDMTLYSRSAKLLLNSGYKDSRVFSSNWSINGRPVNPRNETVLSPYTYQTNDFIVVAFRTDLPLTCNAISKDRKGDYEQYCGGMTVGECLVYHRPLSQEEFRDTEAYLMKKWLGKDHPASAGVSLGALNVTGEEEAVIDADRDLTVGHIAGEATSLIKRGSGTAVVEYVAPESIADGLSAEGGEIDVGTEYPFAKEALFHFDAMDKTAFTTYKEVGTDDVEREFVLYWQDVSRKDNYAQSAMLGLPVVNRDWYDPWKGYYNILTNPTLQQVTMPDGVARPTVHFGGRRNCVAKTGPLDTSGTSFRKIYNTVREVYTVYSDVSGYHGEIIGHLSGGAPGSPDTSTICWRGGEALFNTGYTTRVVQDGYIAIDGVPATCSTKLPSGFHLISVGATGSFVIDSMCEDRDCNGGGGMICEQIAFDHPLTAEQRTLLEKQLMRKWGLATEARPPVETASLKVMNGARLGLGENKVNASALGGDGTVESQVVTLADGAVLPFEFRGADDVDSLTVDGDLVFAGAATVRITTPLEKMKSMDGEWTLLTVTGSVTGLDPASIVLDSGLPEKCNVRLVFGEKSIKLKMSRSGLTVILK